METAKDDVVFTAMGAIPVTESMIEGIEQAYSEGRVPEGYDAESPVMWGRPRLYDEDMASITMRVPVSLKEKLERQAKDADMTMSALIRSILQQKVEEWSGDEGRTVA